MLGKFPIRDRENSRIHVPRKQGGEVHPPRFFEKSGVLLDDRRPPCNSALLIFGADKVGVSLRSQHLLLNLQRSAKLVSSMFSHDWRNESPASCKILIHRAPLCGLFFQYIRSDPKGTVRVFDLEPLRFIREIKGSQEK